MYLKSLRISSGTKTIRDIKFRKGINLVVDESSENITGNNVGKTTVLKLIDFCLGADSKQIYIDPETKKNEYALVKDFLIQNEVLITLILTSNLDDPFANEIIIERNFLSRKQIIRKINGENFSEDEFEPKLKSLIFPEHQAEKPTFRQIISHNIRYKDESINNTLKTLDRYTSDAEYETLYLFLFGCEFNSGNYKQQILTKLKQEDIYKKRLEKQQTKTAYETSLSLINDEIEHLNRKKAEFNLNENFEEDLDSLNNTRYKINKVSSEVSKLEIRRELILEAKSDLSSDKSNIDLQQLKLLYEQASTQVTQIQKTFEDLVNYHNLMIDEKVKFITKDLPTLEDTISSKKGELKTLLSEEKELAVLISKSDSYEELEGLISGLNEQFRKKGEYESIIQQLKEVEDNIKEYTDELSEIDEELFSDEFELTVKNQLNKFNKHFSSISNKLYGEQYAIKYDIVNNRIGQKLYKFSAFNTNLSSGKKQGEISCFDIAYTFFADDEGIPCLHFILNDKKELMHDNQLVKIANLVNHSNIQFVASILKDKLPDEVNNEDYFVIKLSQHDKLFRIESNQNI